MMEILQFYVSGFWVWADITIGLYVVVSGVALTFAAVFKRK